MVGVNLPGFILTRIKAGNRKKNHDNEYFSLGDAFIEVKILIPEEPSLLRIRRYVPSIKTS
jgi:hypothetical protein